MALILNKLSLMPNEQSNIATLSEEFFKLNQEIKCAQSFA